MNTASSGSGRIDDLQSRPRGEIRGQTELVNTRLSGSARVDSTNVLPSGEIRGLTKLIKITEDVRKYAAEQGMSDDKAIRDGMHEKSRQFLDRGAEIYTNP